MSVTVCIDIATSAQGTEMDYKSVRDVSSAYGEKNDCAVVAVSLATESPYPELHRMFRDKGRRDKCGTRLHITEAVVSELGYKLIDITRFIRGRTIRTASRYLRDGCFLVRVSGHILCVRDGEVMDWTKGRQHRVKRIYRVVKEGEPFDPLDYVQAEPVRPQGPDAPAAPSKPRGKVKQTVWALANEVWAEHGRPESVAIVRKLRIHMMDLLEQKGIKRTTASVELGQWQKSALGE